MHTHLQNTGQHRIKRYSITLIDWKLHVTRISSFRGRADFLLLAEILHLKKQSKHTSNEWPLSGQVEQTTYTHLKDY